MSAYICACARALLLNACLGRVYMVTSARVFGGKKVSCIEKGIPRLAPTNGVVESFILTFVFCETCLCSKSLFSDGILWGGGFLRVPLYLLFINIRFVMCSLKI